MNEANLARRMTALAAVVMFLFAALVTRLWFLQVIAAKDYRDASRDNRVRLIRIPAARGEILDRNGQPLVDNRRTIQLVVDKRQIEDEEHAEEVLAELAMLLGAPVEELIERYHDPDYLPYQPVPVRDDVPLDVVSYLGEHQDEFPEVAYVETSTRRYVQGDLAPHVLGYLGQISPDELDDPTFDDYRPGQLVGRGGVEQRYERPLSGVDGVRKQEVNAAGEIQGSIGTRQPEVGYDVVLGIDADIQRLAQETLNEAVSAARGLVDEESGTYLKASAGAVVVMDPNTGHILAMASYPSYDPNIFLDGVTDEEFERLLDERFNSPLNNRAIAGLYPPGSTFKPFVASAAVRAGHADPDGFYECPPEFTVPGDTSETVFHNWTSAHRGTISFAEALVQSCDTVFYPWGLDFWVDRKNGRGDDLFQGHFRQWGFGEVTGVDIPGEQEGRVPDAAWKQEVHAANPEAFPEPTWLPGDNINLSIGQGDLLVTPLQLASAYSALANGGTLYRPSLALRIQSNDGEQIEAFEGEQIGRVPLKPAVRAAILQGLQGVVTSGTGTATAAFSGFPLSTHPVAGKTGTSEVAGRQPHSWFSAFAPADDPQFVVVSVVEEGGHGSQVAAPIVRRVLEGLLDLEPGAFSITQEVED